MVHLLNNLMAEVWKQWNFILHTWFLSVSEIVCPLFMLCTAMCVYKNRWLLSSGKTLSEISSEIIDEKEILDSFFMSRNCVDIIYTPKNKFTLAIMNKLKKDVIPADCQHLIRNYVGLDSEIMLENWFAMHYFNVSSQENTTDVGYGITFWGQIKTQMPEKLMYQIRTTATVVNTDVNFHLFTFQNSGIMEPHFHIKHFLGLQYMIDKAFIELSTDSELPFQILLGEFMLPYEYVSGTKQESVVTLLPMFNMFGFILICPSVVQRIVQEETAGVWKLLQIMGFKKWHFWFCWLLNFVVICILLISIVTILLKIYFDDNRGGYFKFLNWPLLWLLYILFYTSSIIFCFAVSTFINNSAAVAASCSMLIWLVSFSLMTPLLQKPTLFIFQLLSSLIPSIAISWGFYVIDDYEGKETIFKWTDIFEYSRNDGISLGLVMCMLVFDSIFFGLLAWYMDVYMKQYIPLQIKKVYTKESTVEYVTHLSVDESKTESPPENLKVGIQAKDVCKIYDNNIVAIHQLNMDIYRGQVTAILGHSGSGKTTLMSVLTGIISPTAGSVFINNNNINSIFTASQHVFGLCPQNNFLFPYLTVSEHLVYSSMVKGFSKTTSEKYASETLDLLKLTHKKNVKLSELSYGIHRILSVGVAIIGQPQVLVLDEPTTGLDLESRQTLWDILSRLRENRMIIFSTKYMEEAHFYGDWIAVLDQGHVKYYGTSAFIKHVCGYTYLLTVTKESVASEMDITKAVENYVPGVTTLGSFRTQIIYQLILENSPDLSELLLHLEHNKTLLGITNINITSSTTTEDENLRCGELREKNLSGLDSGKHSLRNANTRLTGFTLTWVQFKALLKKKTWYIQHNFCIFILFMVASTLLIILILPKKNLSEVDTFSPLSISLSVYNNAVIMMPSLDTDRTEILSLFEDFINSNGGSVQYMPTDTAKVLVKAAEKKQNSSSQIVAVTYLKSFNWTVLYNRILSQAPAISLNLVTNTIIKFLKGPKFGIVIFNHPLNIKNSESTCNDYKVETGENIGYIWVLIVPQGLLLFLSNFVTLPALERLTLTKHLQLMSNLSPLIYWTSLFVYDFFIYVINISIMICGILIVDETYYFARLHSLGILALILLLYGSSGIIQGYAFSLYGGNVPETVSVYLIFNICTGTTASLLMFCVHKVTTTIPDSFIDLKKLSILNYVFALNPHYSLCYSLLLYGMYTYQNGVCQNCTENIDCKTESFMEYLSEENPAGLLNFFLMMLLDFFIYFGLLLLVDFGGMPKIYSSFLNIFYGIEDLYNHQTFHVNVQREMEKTIAARNLAGEHCELTGLIVDRLSKKYSCNLTALTCVSFHTAPGECFGLVGINGAGKTTVFKLLSAYAVSTLGEAFASGLRMNANRTKYMAQIGYCPQLNSLIETLTPEKILLLIGSVRGIHPEKLSDDIDKTLKALGLQEYRTHTCDRLDNENKRKVCVGIAVIGSPPVLLLDEPTTGVDNITRWRIWNMIMRCQSQGQTIVLSSHSMFECQILCTRLTILFNGIMMYIGSPSYLKQKYGKGYSIIINVYNDQTEEYQEKRNKIKHAITGSFQKCTLKEEIDSLLRFRIRDKRLQLSHLFVVLENIKKENTVIEHYSVYDTTLSRVVLSLTKRSRKDLQTFQKQTKTENQEVERKEKIHHSR